MECIELKVVPTDNESDTEVFILVSNVLCYINSSLQNCLPSNVKRISVHEFSCTDIVNAKKLLWSCNAAAGLLPEFKERRGSTNRSLSDANVEDIIEGLQALDKKDHKMRFMTDNLKDLPKYSPENLNTVAMLRRIEDLESKYLITESAANHNTIELSSLADRLQVQTDKVKTLDETLATHAVLIDGLQSHKPDDPAVNPPEDPPASADTSAGTSDQAADHPVDEQQQREDSPAQSEGDRSASSSVTDSDMNSESSDEEEVNDNNNLPLPLPPVHLRPSTWSHPPRKRPHQQQGQRGQVKADKHPRSAQKSVPPKQ